MELLLCSTVRLLAAVLPASCFILPYLIFTYLILPRRLCSCRSAPYASYHAPSICSQYGAFKESICSALERSSRAVEDAKISMDELADQAELIVQVAARNLIFYPPPLLPPALPCHAIDLFNKLSLSHLLSLLLAHPS